MPSPPHLLHHPTLPPCTSTSKRSRKPLRPRATSRLCAAASTRHCSREVSVSLPRAMATAVAPMTASMHCSSFASKRMPSSKRSTRTKCRCRSSSSSPSPKRPPPFHNRRRSAHSPSARAPSSRSQTSASTRRSCRRSVPRARRLRRQAASQPLPARRPSAARSVVPLRRSAPCRQPRCCIRTTSTRSVASGSTTSRTCARPAATWPSTCSRPRWSSSRPSSSKRPTSSCNPSRP